MKDGFDIKELTQFEKNLINIAQKQMPKESKQFLRKEGTKLKKKTLSKARAKVNKGDGGYLKSIKRGKTYKYRENGGLAVRVYSSAPHAHLIEYGHRQVLNPFEDGKVANLGERYSKGVKEGKGIGTEIGFVPGRRVFEESAKQFESEYYDDAQKFIESVLGKGLS